MAKVILDVDDKNLDTVLTILKNLKSGLVKNMTTDSAVVSSSVKKTSPNKYMSKSNYKQKLQQQKVLEDEFLPSTTSNSRYLSPKDFKDKLKRN